MKSKGYERKIEGLPVSDEAYDRAFKYTLQKAAGSVMHDVEKTAAQQHPVCWCNRGMVNPTGVATLYVREDGGSARFHGTTTCKSVWACPVCSAKICAKRQSELGSAVTAWVKSGEFCEFPRAGTEPTIKSTNYVWLMTLTFPHELDEVLAPLVEKFGKAKTHFKNSKVYKRILAKNVRRGSVSALEITVGEHGWHPHQHDLVFATADAFGDVHQVDTHGRLASSLIAELKGQWYTSLRKAGLCERDQMNAVLDHGLDIRGGQKAAEYIAKFGREEKWGLSREVTMHAAKVGTDSKGAHPFQVLAWASEGDGLAAQQFREYCAAFQGKRMLSWSKGLKKELTGIEEISDDEAADAEMPAENATGVVDAECLSILHSRKLLANFIAYASTWCRDKATAQKEIDCYFEWARTIGRNSRGTVKVKMWSGESRNPDLRRDGFMYVDCEEFS